MVGFIILTMVLAAVGVLQNLIFNRRRFDNWVITTWGKFSCYLFNIKVRVNGAEKLASKQGAIVLFNHTSFMDVITMAGYLNNIRFGAKIELFKIPLFGLAIKRFGTLPIARNNREEVFKVYEEAKFRFARGEKFALSPEGGRYHGDRLAPFKAGPFVFAINSQVPLIPVVIKGAYACWPKGAILANSDRWSREVEISVLDPILTVGFDVKDRSKLQEKSYEMMNSYFQN